MLQLYRGESSNHGELKFGKKETASPINLNLIIEKINWEFHTIKRLHHQCA
jgi:hypothetical protein